MNQVMTQPLADLRDESVRMTDAAQAASVHLRITGGVAIAVRCPSASSPPLQRTYADIDVVGSGRERRQIGELMRELGYQANEPFNKLHGKTRQFYWDPVHERHVDVFLDEMEMCHLMDFSERLDIHPQTLSLADLLLGKLQVVETNSKDYLDILALLVDQDMTDDERGINLDYLAGLAAGDWGLWRTTSMVAERALTFADGLEGFAHRDRVHQQVHTYLGALSEVPKTRKWKLRARIGERKCWYALPEEEQH